MNKLFSFGVVSDVQYASKASNYPEKRPATLGTKKLSEALGALNDYNLEFIISLGDLIDRDPSNFSTILQIFKRTNTPVWHTLGNHDFKGPDYENGYKKEALTALGMTDDTRYYFRDVSSFRFIILDSNEVGIIEHKENTPEWKAGKDYLDILQKKGKINAQSWNGAISAKQIAWLDKSIVSAEEKGLKCVVFAHHPIYPEHRENALNDTVILQNLAHKKNVVAYINGHNHDGNYGVYKSLPCWTIEGMMDYEDKTAYAVVDVYEDRLEIKGFGRTKDRIIKLRG